MGMTYRRGAVWWIKAARFRSQTRSVFERYNIVSECDLVDAAQKLNVLQPVRPAGSEDPALQRESDPTSQIATGLASPKPHSGDVGLAPPKPHSGDVGLAPPKRRSGDVGLAPPKRRSRDVGLAPPKRRSRDVGLAPPKRRSREGGHNSGTVEPNRAPRLKVSL